MIAISLNYHPLRVICNITAIIIINYRAFLNQLACIKSYTCVFACALWRWICQVNKVFLLVLHCVCHTGEHHRNLPPNNNNKNNKKTSDESASACVGFISEKEKKRRRKKNKNTTRVQMRPQIPTNANTHMHNLATFSGWQQKSSLQAPLHLTSPLPSSPSLPSPHPTITSDRVYL